MKSKNIIATSILENMSVDHLRGLAKAAGVKVGKSKSNTVSNLIGAIGDGPKALHAKIIVTFSTNPALPGESSKRVNHFAATFRTYKSGPGQENVIWVTPESPVEGSPMSPV